MNRRDRVILTIIFVQIAIAVCLVHLNGAAEKPEQILEVATARTLIIGDQPLIGNPEAEYVLVEFGDYQCPACCAAYSEVEDLLARYPGKVAFQFRQLPLRQIHRYAMPAALIAEAARYQGKFLAVHQSLFGRAAAIDEGYLRTLPRFGDDADSFAARRVAADQKAADALLLDSTPSLFLCGPGGKSFRLQSVGQAATYLRSVR